MFADIFTCFAGELPKELGQLTNLTNFDASYNAQYEKDEDGYDDHDRPIPGTDFTGGLYAPAYVRVGLLTFSLFAGELPKWLGDLVNLTHFDASHNKFQGESYAPTYMHCMFLDIFLLFYR